MNSSIEKILNYNIKNKCSVKELYDELEWSTTEGLDFYNNEEYLDANGFFDPRTYIEKKAENDHWEKTSTFMHFMDVSESFKITRALERTGMDYDQFLVAKLNVKYLSDYRECDGIDGVEDELNIYVLPHVPSVLYIELGREHFVCDASKERLSREISLDTLLAPGAKFPITFVFTDSVCSVTVKSVTIVHNGLYQKYLNAVHIKPIYKVTIEKNCMYPSKLLGEVQINVDGSITYKERLLTDSSSHLGENGGEWFSGIRDLPVDVVSKLDSFSIFDMLELIVSRVKQ